VQAGYDLGMFNGIAGLAVVLIVPVQPAGAQKYYTGKVAFEKIEFS
jgi:hypothetical protein